MNWKQTIFAGLIIIVAGIAAFYGYQYMNATPAPEVTRASGAGIAQGGSSSALLTLLGSLKGLKFDTSFFDDRTYKSLQDMTPEIVVPEKRGKPNPFIATEISSE